MDTKTDHLTPYCEANRRNYNYDKYYNNKFLYTCAQLHKYDVLPSLIIGERAKRARRYLVMSMESRDIYIYIYTYVCF